MNGTLSKMFALTPERAALLMALSALLTLGAVSAQAAKPNIILIYADDIGYGDLGCYGATKVRTPNLDRLAKEGIRFTDGHAASATCTPSRYALLTGQYPWRKKGTGILPGDANLIIPPGTTTLPAHLQKAGYETAVIGKWHLGLGEGGPVDWNTLIKPGPREIGFDHSFIIPATGDRTPCVYVENGRVAGLDPNDPIQVSYKQQVGDEPTGKQNPDLLKMKLTHGHDMTIVNGISRIGWMTGGKAARWVDEDMADVLAKKAVEFIDQKREKPFFLYFATHDIHVPRVPHARFAGKSQSGTRGDVIEQLDATVGVVLEALDRLKIADDTLVMFSSDNGPVLDDGYADGAVQNLNGHKPAGDLKGNKYSLFEAGTRVPFLARWPARIKPAESGALVCQIDLLGSFAALTETPLPDDAAPDSFNVLPALLGEHKIGRENLVEHAAGMAIRKGPWKLIPGGEPTGGGQGKSPEPRLFNLANDLGETKNVAAAHPQVVEELTVTLHEIKTKSRTRP